MIFRHHETFSICITKTTITAVNLPLSVGDNVYFSLALLGLHYQAMIQIFLVFIVEVVWGSRSSNDRLAVQTSPKPDGGLSCFAEEVVSQWTRETRTVEMLRLVSVMLASVALS